jgi:hypothetical protein
MNDLVAGARAEAKIHREQARRLRLAIQAAPYGDPLGALKQKIALGERVRLARQCDARAKELAAQVPRAPRWSPDV